MAEDLTVETFWRIYRARARFDTKAQLRALGAADRDQCSTGLSEDGPSRGGPLGK